MNKLLIAAVATMMSGVMTAQNNIDKPFGYATCASRTDSAQKFDVTGGGALAYPVPDSCDVVVLKAVEPVMTVEILKAVTNHKVVVLDGSEGDFVVDEVMRLVNLEDRTVLGINNARLCTKWYVSKEIKDRLNAEGVPNMSTTGNGGVLVNGKKVREEAEYNTRRILIEMLNDTIEQYKQSGVFIFSGCRNVVIRNLTFIGPGSIDVGGTDLLCLNRSQNVWVDHCSFVDGMDGNFDINMGSNFITVSWCTFSYTGRSYDHQNTNLVGSNDHEAKGSLNVTFAYNVWGNDCNQRMPMARAGLIHVLNNYYNCKGNTNVCINARANSEFLIEGNYFAPEITRIFAQKDAVAWQWDVTNVIATEGVEVPKSRGEVKVPYNYSVLNAEKLPETLSKESGATINWK